MQNYELCRLLIKHGVDLESKDKGGFTALDISVDLGLENIFDLLTSSGANVKVKPGLVLKAIIKGNITVLETVLSSFGSMDKSGLIEEALQTAIYIKNFEVCRLLICNGAPVDFVDK